MVIWLEGSVENTTMWWLEEVRENAGYLPQSLLLTFYKRVKVGSGIVYSAIYFI
jgi:hypothetical protein